jgi:hypothetical protein
MRSPWVGDLSHTSKGDPTAPVGVSRVADALQLVERDSPRNTSVEIGARTPIYQQH